MSEAYQTRPLTPLRKVIAARMSEANRDIPHFRVAKELELDALMGFREELNAQADGQKLSLNDFFVKATAAALKDAPGVNVQFVNGDILEYGDANISVITAVEGGLATPVIFAADKKSIWRVAEEIRDLTTRAAKGALRIDEMQGGSFSISNLGMYGVDFFDAIINPPQCAILAVARARRRTGLGEDGKFCTRTTMTAVLSADHRAIDGVAGARFLAALQEKLLSPDRLVE